MEQYKGDVRTTWICSPVTYASVVHSTWPSRVMWRVHAPTCNQWHKKKNKNKKVTLHMLTHGIMRRCGLTSWVVCINNKFCDARERNVTIRSEIWTMNIHSLGFWDVREYVTLWGLILWSLGCTCCSYNISLMHNITSLSSCCLGNITMGCWELTLNLNLLVEGLCIPWLHSHDS